MNIEQLRYFNTVAHLENITKAADYLHMSQSALTKHIQRLESEIGVPLFDRNGKRIFLNKAGMRFYDSSTLILREMQSAKEDLDMLVSKKDPRIRIGCTGMPEKMLKCLGEFSSAYPNSFFIINSRIEFENQIDINQYDALICPAEFRFEKLNGFPLYNESYFFAAGKNSPAASGTVFHMKMLEGLPLVFMRGESLTPEYPYRICTATDLTPKTVFFTDSRELHRRMISDNIAVGFVPESESESYSQDPAIRLYPILDNRFNRPVKICFLREKHLSELGLLFREYVIRYFNLEQRSDPPDEENDKNTS